MADLPAVPLSPGRTMIASMGYGQPLHYNRSPTAGAWPSANLAIYIPIIIESQVTAYRMFFGVGAAAGNVDLGIYHYNKNLLVNTGSTVVAGTNVPQTIDITDTVLIPGRYWFGMVASTITTLTVMRVQTYHAQVYRAMGVNQEALGATTLPATATFSTAANSFLPMFGIVTKNLDL